MFLILSLESSINSNSRKSFELTPQSQFVKIKVPLNTKLLYCPVGKCSCNKLHCYDNDANPAHCPFETFASTFVSHV